jgi:hypothetical protein
MPSRSRGHVAEPVRRMGFPQTVDYIVKTYGLKMTEGALRMHRFKGTGPKSSVILRKVYFEPAEIDKWITSLVSDSDDSHSRARKARL